VTLDLALTDEQAELARTVRAFCQRHCTEADVRASVGAFPGALWDGLAALGILGLATPEGGGGALEVVVAMEELGQANCPGPLVPTVLALSLLPEELRAGVASGEAVVAVSEAGRALVPWAPVADLWIQLDGADAWLCSPTGEVQPVATLGGEPWGRVELRANQSLGSLGAAAALSDTALAAYLCGAGFRLLEAASAWARDRVQFGQPIGNFQAVAHPLASVAVHLVSARQLTRAAADTFDRDRASASARVAAGTARLSSTGAALDAAFVAHQIFGAIGFTDDGPVGMVSQRIRQVSLLPPGPEAARMAILDSFDL
jgi:alkylation response protein AidB-like acyl-CoA dehydrogenase